MKNQQFFLILLLFSLLCFLLTILILNENEGLFNSLSKLSRGFDRRRDRGSDQDLTLPSIYDWLPNTENKSESFVPKWKISRDRFELLLLV